jgi:murein tripeptide amidase MpaA
LYHGTVHAREWIAAPVVEYITRQLILGYNAGDEEVQSFLDKYDFYVIPIVNPDGFVYSQVADRLWRKNRQPGPAGSTCVGRDINRNWEFGWDANPLGASTNPCSQTYKGARPADSPENAALDAFARKLRDGAGIKLYIDWHSYGQYILSPFGYKETLYAPELGKWTKASSILSEVIRDSSERRTTFTFGPSGATLYTTTGAAPDHMYSIGRADWSFTIELPDTGDNGFVLPPEAIRGAAEEQWEGQKVLYSLLDETFFDGRGPAALYTGQ